MSTARRRQLGSWLVKLRKQSGCDVTDASRALGCSESKIRHVEAGRSKVKKAELDLLVELYGASAEVRSQLEETRLHTEERGWWESYRVPEWFAPFVDFESFATEAANFELDLIPGLLQTERYAYEIHRAGRYTTNPQDIARRVKARVERQKRLVDEAPIQLRAVIGEAALHRVVGGHDVMAEQLQQVAEFGELPNVIVQVLPFEAGAHASPSGSFIVLSFEHPEDEAIGFLDTPLGGHIIDRAEDVSALRYVFDELRSHSLPVAATLDRVTAAREAHQCQQRKA
ncbi:MULTISPECIES: helix-turn-helix transcriptional regulator [unclassified Saccharopolyspora]|uniref:helix-turn-helix domain-containing protein n=1 Tax=unclassified Saccharopolyspora TaxID=2646250 RepID=UPI001CD6F8EB|nr:MULTISPECIES: helix-turn-helix transcriptional regulator [unclassified Saccharopolyspora]MCA1190364.1 helix-turn-helix domain-containing protein [Saccharopolyspora sp. 6T]MCA1195252.1 helix-turn-helix domain-containing protein [Saccharopolyspora sp. 6V]MCA1227091.1 helix-turn-helix domain-containing protein [Saccharopolyspora sp. 6M]MCA1283589.1 helix-turn-helix domain-containing protein [Saccharopolyspora sp. 7B]